MIKVFLLAINILLLCTFPSEAIMVIHPDDPVIIDHKGKIYLIKYSERKDIASIKNLPRKKLNKNRWKKIIAKGDPQIAQLLLKKLASYLPKKELWQYIKTGLMRKEHKLNDLIADQAYLLWQKFASTKELLAMRIDPQYRQNLSVLSTWRHMFTESDKEFNTPQKAIEKIERIFANGPVILWPDRNSLKKLRTTIALSDDISLHEKMIHHENFHITLSSMYAIARQNPKKFAHDILSKAIFDDEVFEYEYFYSDVGSNDSISLGQAAYDLFSDYLTYQQLVDIVASDPKVLDGTRRLTVENDKLARAMLPHKVDNNYNSIKFSLQYWEKDQIIFNNLKEYNSSQLQSFMLTSNMQSKMTSELFSKKVYDALISLREKNWVDDQYFFAEWVEAAFEVHNTYARKYIEHILNDNDPSLVNKEVLMIFKYKKNWPRDWQDLKEKAHKMIEGINIDEY